MFCLPLCLHGCVRADVVSLDVRQSLHKFLFRLLLSMHSFQSSASLFKIYTGACGSCPSSTTTMKMGIERVLKEKFGEAVKEIRQVFDDQQTETTVAVSIQCIFAAKLMQ